MPERWDLEDETEVGDSYFLPPDPERERAEARALQMARGRRATRRLWAEILELLRGGGQ